MPEKLLEIKNVSKYFGFPALLDVSAYILKGERFGLIGPNGSGKTTLINLITGVDRCDQGRILFDDKDITKLEANVIAKLGIARTFQIPKPFWSMTVIENLKVPLRYRPSAHYQNSDPDEEAGRILELLGILSKADLMPVHLTQIDLRRLELARALALHPKVLILDEVMAGLSSSEMDEILLILRGLNDQGIAVIMIEHIMEAVMNFCERIVVLNAGQKIAEEPPEAILKNKEVERAYLGE